MASLFPVTGRAFDFADVAVDFDVTAGLRGRNAMAGRFLARVTGASFHGRFAVDHGYLLTGLAGGRGVTG